MRFIYTWSRITFGTDSLTLADGADYRAMFAIILVINSNSNNNNNSVEKSHSWEAETSSAG
jgi:hypothetical protein